MSVSIHPRGSTDTCVKCKRKFASADRVQIAYIVKKVGCNPHNPREMGAWLGDEFEMVHILCEDPQLNGSIILGVPRG